MAQDIISIMQRLAAYLSCITLAIGAIMLTLPAFGKPSQLAGEPMYAALYGLIGRVGAHPPDSPKAAEELMGIRLELTSENVFRRYEVRGVHINGLPVDLVDYRDSQDRAATSGPFLGLTFVNSCMSRNEILSHFNDLKLLKVPDGHSSDEQIEYSQVTNWGQLGFGFSEMPPNCLRGLTFLFKLPEAGS
jgi:hypothetical protein